MINGLVKKGWNKNEIISETQRVWGQDVVILPQMIDDDRSIASKYGLKMFTGMVLMTPLAMRFIRSGGYK